MNFVSGNKTRALAEFLNTLCEDKEDVWGIYGE